MCVGGGMHVCAGMHVCVCDAIAYHPRIRACNRDCYFIRACACTQKHPRTYFRYTCMCVLVHVRAHVCSGYAQKRALIHL